MRPEVAVLVLGMALVTYAARGIPLLTPGIERLPPLALAYLRLVGPAVLASLVASQVLVQTDGDGRAAFHVGIEWVAVAACVAVVVWRRSLLAGLLVAVAIVAVGRAIGVG